MAGQADTAPTKARADVIGPVAALAVFAPIFHNALGYDELLHLYGLANFGVSELLLKPHAGHLLFFSNLVYIPLYTLAGARPAAYAAVSLLTHLVNVVLCYHLVLRLTGRATVAALATTMWGCAAFHQSSVGNFAVYGQLVVATVFLLLLHRVADARADRAPGVLVDVLLLFVAAGSFGYGLMLAAVWPAVQTWMLDEEVRPRAVVSRFLLSVIAVATLYVVMGVLYGAVSHRLPSDAPASWDGMQLTSPWDVIVLGRSVLDRLGYGVTNTFVAPVVSLVRGLPGPPGFLGSWLGVVPAEPAFLAFRVVAVAWLAAWLWWAGHRAAPVRRLALGVGAIAVGCYATVAATRDIGSALSSFFQVPMMLTGRYHYLPTLALTVATASVIPPVPRAPASLRRALVAIAMTWTAVLIVLDHATVRAWPARWDTVGSFEQGIRRSVGGYPVGSVVYLDNNNAPVGFPIQKVTLPGSAAMALLTFPDGVVDGRRVRFVERDPALLAQLRRKPDAPIARLVVAPEEVPPNAQYRR